MKQKFVPYGSDFEMDYCVRSNYVQDNMYALEHNYGWDMLLHKNDPIILAGLADRGYNLDVLMEHDNRDVKFAVNKYLQDHGYIDINEWKKENLIANIDMNMPFSSKVHIAMLEIIESIDNVITKYGDKIGDSAIAGIAGAIEYEGSQGNLEAVGTRMRDVIEKKPTSSLLPRLSALLHKYDNPVCKFWLCHK